MKFQAPVGEAQWLEAAEVRVADPIGFKGHSPTVRRVGVDLDCQSVLAPERVQLVALHSHVEVRSRQFGGRDEAAKSPLYAGAARAMLEAVPEDRAEPADAGAAAVRPQGLDEVALADEPAQNRLIHGAFERAFVEDSGEVDEGADGAGDREAAPGAHVAWGEGSDLVKPDTGLLPMVDGPRDIHDAL